MATLPDPVMKLLRIQMLSPGRVAGLTSGRLEIVEDPAERPAVHASWDRYERAASELFNTPEPWPNSVNSVIAAYAICYQALVSRNDPVMLDRLGRLLDISDHAELVLFSELFIRFVFAQRPTVAA